MAEPLGILAGIIGIATATIKAAKCLARLIDDYEHGSHEVHSISRDIQAFYPIVRALIAALEEERIWHLVESDEVVAETVRNLYRPLSLCRALLGELMVHIQRPVRKVTHTRTHKVAVIDAQWTFFTKTKIKTLQAQLESSKSTLCTALNVISLYVRTIWKIPPAPKLTTSRLCGVRSLAQGEFLAVHLSTRSCNSTVSSDNIQKVQPASSYYALSSSQSHGENSLIANAQEWKGSSLQGDLPVQHPWLLHGWKSQKPSIKAKCLERTTTQYRGADFEPHQQSHNTAEVSNASSYQSSWRVKAHEQDHDDMEMFYECVSTLPAHGQSSSLTNDYSILEGSPQYYFESRSSFFPEQYFMQSVVTESTVVLAMIQAKSSHLQYMYFLLYAENPRQWRKITVSATFSHVKASGEALQVSVSDSDDGNCKLLPRAIQNVLEPLLDRLEIFYSVTSISLSLKEDDCGHIVLDSPAIEVCENTLEVQTSNEDRILQEIEHLACPQFVEPDIVVLSRMSSSTYHVLAGIRKCIEQKAPFATAGKHGDNGFKDFCRDLKFLHSLYDCAGVVKFIGVVLDRTGRHLKSYLYESTTIGSLRRFLTVVNSETEHIPWAVREIWSRQIVEAVAEVHRRNKVVGLLDLANIGLRADGSAMLTHLKTSQRHIPNEKGLLAPELWVTQGRDSKGKLHNLLNFQTDIFQLGLILWLLAEHRPKVVGYLCTKYACTHFPRYTCIQAHVNPVELPPCCSGIPAYITDIITKCRSSDPTQRPSARSLLEKMPFTGSITDRAPTIPRYLEIIAPKVAYFSPHCDECGVLARDLHYHCNVCFNGDFDLCPQCIQQGVHCFDPKHHMVRRILENGRFVLDAE